MTSFHKYVHPTSPVNNTPGHAGRDPSSDLPSTSGQSLVSYLTQHHFQIQTLPSFCQIIGGLIPGFRASAQPTNSLPVVFVELPDQRLYGHLEVDRAYITKTEVDRETFSILSDTVPKSIGRAGASRTEMGTELVPVIMASSVCAYTFKIIHTLTIRASYYSRAK